MMPAASPSIEISGSSATALANLTGLDFSLCGDDGSN